MKSMKIRLNAVMQYVVVGLVVIIIVKDGISQKKEKWALASLKLRIVRL